jgi:PleD family two-component response regulator
MSEQARVLIVDDQMSNLLALEQVLSDVEARIVKATSANEALLIMLHQAIDCILVDVSMPEIDGLEYLKLVRSDPAHKNVPVIMVTGKIFSENEMQKAYKFGAVDFLFKPLDSDTVTQKVGFIVQQARQLRRLKELGSLLDDLDAGCINPLTSLIDSHSDSVIVNQLASVRDRLKSIKSTWETFDG